MGNIIHSQHFSIGDGGHWRPCIQLAYNVTNDVVLTRPDLGVLR